MDERTTEQLQAVIAAQQREIDTLLESNAKMSIAYLGLRMLKIEDGYRELRAEVKKQVERIDNRIDVAGREFKKLRKEQT